MIKHWIFQLTPSRRATVRSHSNFPIPHISTHALTEGDGGGSRKRKSSKISTHALTEGDQPGRRQAAIFRTFQLTPSRRATTDSKKNKTLKYISTHALTEGDDLRGQVLTATLNFNSRPHGGRPDGARKMIKHWIFQLTPSRRATSRAGTSVASAGYFNSRPHGGRHPPLFVEVSGYEFQLTPSRRATKKYKTVECDGCISTHALTEGDSRAGTSVASAGYFNSRPHGGRHHLTIQSSSSSAFQLTPSRRATLFGASIQTRNTFQLTPSRRATCMRFSTQ